MVNEARNLPEEMIRGASISALLKLASTIIQLLSTTDTIIAEVRRKYLQNGEVVMEEGTTDNAHASSRRQNGTLISHRDETTRPNSLPPTQRVKSEPTTQWRQTKKDRGKDAENVIAMSELLNDLPRSAIEEIAAEFNEMINGFEQELQGLTLNFESDVGQQNLKDPAKGDPRKSVNGEPQISRESAIEMLRGLFSQLMDVADKIPGSNKKIIALLEQILKEPEVKRGSSEGGPRSSKQSARATLPPPNDRDRPPKRFWTKVKDFIAKKFKKKEKEEIPHT